MESLISNIRTDIIAETVPLRYELCIIGSRFESRGGVYRPSIQSSCGEKIGCTLHIIGIHKMFQQHLQKSATRLAKHLKKFWLVDFNSVQSNSA